MWAGVEKGFLKEVCTALGSEGFHGEKTKGWSQGNHRVCVDPRLNQCGAEGRLLRPRSQRACSQAREGFAGKGQGFILPLGKGLGDSPLFATLL